ncbi:MAG: DUF6498-containing protein [Candidatus Omnitrophota bacterium]
MIIENKEIKDISILPLILANLAPIFGVLFFRWDIFSVIFLYWQESAIIGFYNILKMYKANGTKAADITINDIIANKLSKVFIIVFFMFHYGMFMLVHGMFIFVIFARQKPIFSYKFFMDNYYFAILLLFISHGISYYVNFIGKEEYKKISVSEQMQKPYSRIIAMHLTILLSAFLVMAFGKQTIISLFILIAIKIAMDLRAHIKEHKQFTNI